MKNNAILSTLFQIMYQYNIFEVSLPSEARFKRLQVGRRLTKLELHFSFRRVLGSFLCMPTPLNQQEKLAYLSSNVMRVKRQTDSRALNYNVSRMHSSQLADQVIAAEFSRVDSEEVSNGIMDMPEVHAIILRRGLAGRSRSSLTQNLYQVNCLIFRKL